MSEWNALAVRYVLRQFMATLLEWNPAVGRKWLQVGERAMSCSAAPQQEASPWHQALTQIADEAATLVERNIAVSSPPATALADRLTQICSDYSLGDPMVYARWAGAMQFRQSAHENARRRSAWEYLAAALQARTPSASKR